VFRLPLHGIRVLDLTMGWAAPYATRLLADMGAEVIKIEATNRWDPLRSLSGAASGAERAWDRSPYFNHMNRNKYGCALDISKPRGRDLFLELVAISNVVVESFGTGAMEELDLGYRVLQEANPEIIVVSLTGQEEHQAIYGEAVAGVAATGAIALALWHRRRTGRGQYIEVDRQEALVGLMGGQILGLSMKAQKPHPLIAPQGCYPCSGDEQWLTLACQDDAQFAALCDIIGRRDLAADPRFADGTGRHRNRDALNGLIAAWTRGRTKEEAAEALQAAGVPAMPVLSVPDVFADPHLRARGFFELVSHSVAGVWEVEGPHWRLSESPAHIRLPAPAFGEHNEYVFRYLLGLSQEEIEALAREGLIAGRPEWPTER